MVTRACMMSLFRDVTTRLQAIDTRAPDATRFEAPDWTKRCAVLVPLRIQGDVIEIMLTKRAAELRHYANKVAFPGGKMDPCDENETEAALREAYEEVGLKKCDVTVVTVLPPMAAPPRYVITPVVGFVNSTFVPLVNKSEVAFVFWLPLKRFLEDEKRTMFELLNLESEHVAYMHEFDDDVDGGVVHTGGATAYFCVLVAVIVYAEVNVFPGQCDIRLDHVIDDALKVMQRVLDNIKSKVITF